MPLPDGTATVETPSDHPHQPHIHVEDKGLTGYACVVYYRHQLLGNVKTLVLVGALPLLGALILTGVFIKSCVDLSDPANSASGDSWFGIGPPLHRDRVPDLRGDPDGHLVPDRTQSVLPAQDRDRARRRADGLSSDAWRLRRARPADVDVLIALWERSVRATHHFLGEDDIVALRPLVAEALGGGALELWALVGDDDVPLGFIGLDGDDISALFLEPAWRGRGGGRRLVGHAQALRGGALTVDVNEQNPGAVGFYEALGFTVVGRSPLDDGGRPFPLLHLRRRAPSG
jgi:putative acetyltransferase